MMKTLKMKIAFFSFLAVTLISVLLTSCEQENVPTPDIKIEQDITQAEIDEAKAEYDLIMSYGEEVASAYKAYNEGGILTYYPPLGVNEFTEFDWSNYHAIMEHSKILYTILENDAHDIYEDNLPTGTYLTKEHMEQLTPELISVLDDTTISNIESRYCNTYSSGCPYVYYGWHKCGTCHVVHFASGPRLVHDWCFFCDTACACYPPVRVTRNPGC